MTDPVNHPSHYTEGRQYEVIEILEDWAQFAPDPVAACLYWNACKYMARMFSKGNPAQDARKARWYLDRLIARLNQKEDAEAARAQSNRIADLALQAFGSDPDPHRHL